MKLIKISPDKEKARNILKMVSLIEDGIKKRDRPKMSSLIASDYYEIIKELLTALLLLDGYKTLSHVDLIEYAKAKCSYFSSYEMSVLDELRILRNKIAYDGFLINESYLSRNENLFIKAADKLKEIIKDRLD